MKAPRPGKCIAQCSANYKYYTIKLDDGNLTTEIVEKLKAQEHILSLQRCTYCGTIWAEIYKASPGLQILKIGTRDVSDGKMVWYL